MSATRKGILRAHRIQQTKIAPRTVDAKSVMRDQVADWKRWKQFENNKPQNFPPELTLGEVKGSLFGTPYHREFGTAFKMKTGDKSDLVPIEHKLRSAKDSEVVKRCMKQFHNDPRNIPLLSRRELRKILRSMGVIPTADDKEQLVFQLCRALASAEHGGGVVVLEERQGPKTIPSLSISEAEAASTANKQQLEVETSDSEPLAAATVAGNAGANARSASDASVAGIDSSDSSPQARSSTSRRSQSLPSPEQEPPPRASLAEFGSILEPLAPLPQTDALFKSRVDLSSCHPKNVRLSMTRRALLLENLSNKTLSLHNCSLVAVYKRRPATAPQAEDDGWTGGRWTPDSPNAHFHFPTRMLVPPLGAVIIAAGPGTGRYLGHNPELPCPIQRLCWNPVNNPLAHAWAISLLDGRGGRNQMVTTSVLKDRAQAAQRAAESNGGNTAPTPAEVMQRFAEEIQTAAREQEWCGEGDLEDEEDTLPVSEYTHTITGLKRLVEADAQRRTERPLQHPSDQGIVAEVPKAKKHTINLIREYSLDTW